MEKTYCGACRGERGCAECKMAARSAVYTGLTEFYANEETKDSGCLKGDALQKKASHPVALKRLLLAADIGTTTLAFVCADENGTILASYGAENPQRRTAADVIGRIDAALHGEGERLKHEIREALAKGFLFVLEEAVSPVLGKEIETEAVSVRVAMAGNTTMQHLLLGYPVEGLAKAPFTPHSADGVTVDFAALFGETECYSELQGYIKTAKAELFPCFSAFVGADIAAGAYALFSDLWEPVTGNREIVTEISHGNSNAARNRLLLDLGTNGELLLVTKNRIYGTAAAMGSAFEGGRFAYASDLFRLLAKALQEGVLDETGLLDEPYFSKGFHELYQDDVREFQLAKGALRAGIHLLCARAGIEVSDITQVYVAGGVGKFCCLEDLFGADLLPKEFCGKTTLVGNSCIGGLLRYLKNEETMVYCKGEILNLAEEPGFEEVYYRFMNFE